MIMLVDFDRFDETFLVEPKLFLELINDFHVYLVEISACIEAHSLRLMDLVPWMVPYTLYIDPLIGVCVENPAYHVLCLIGEELRQSVLSIEDLLVKIGCLLIL
jgi:hypothetical protein